VPGRPPTNGYVIGRGSWTSAANQTPARLAAIMHGRRGTHVATWADLAAWIGSARSTSRREAALIRVVGYAIRPRAIYMTIDTRE